MSKFGQYLWKLLSRVFKQSKENVFKWVMTLGELLDETKQLMFVVRRNWLISTATGHSLDLHGEARGVPRYPGESDELYKRRIQAAFEIYRAGGTVPGMIRALQLLGYPGAVIHELFRDGPVIPFHNSEWQYNGCVHHKGGVRWAEFDVKLGIEDSRPFSKSDLAILMDTIYKIKPAHTMPAAIDLTLCFEEFLESRDVTKLMTLVGLDDNYRYVGISRNAAIRYNASQFLHNGLKQYQSRLYHTPVAGSVGPRHDTRRDHGGYALKVAMTDEQKAPPIMRTGCFKRTDEVKYGSNLPMLETQSAVATARIADAVETKETVAIVPRLIASEQFPRANCSHTTSGPRFTGNILHDGRSKHKQTGIMRNGGIRYGHDKVLDGTGVDARLTLADVMPGTRTYGEVWLHDGGGQRWRRNGIITRKPLVNYKDNPYLHNGLLLRSMTARKYGDKANLRDGLRLYGARRVHDGTMKRGANGLGDDMVLVLKRHGRMVERISA